MKKSPENFTGVDAVRDALRQKAKQLNLVGLASNLQVSMASLELFMRGHHQPSDDVLKALAEWIWQGHAKFDPETRMLGPTNKLGDLLAMMRPPPLDPSKLPRHEAVRGQRGPQPVKAPPPAPVGRTRPGFVSKYDGW